MNKINIKEALANAEVLRQSGNIEGAFELNQLITQVSPKTTEAWYNLGLIATDMQRYDLAEDFFSEALKWNKRSPDYFNALGETQLKLNKVAEARKHFEKALKRNPSSVRAMNNLGQSYEAENDLQNAEKQYQRALRIVPEDAALRINLSSLYIKTEQFEKSTQLLLRCPLQVLLADPRLLYNKARSEYGIFEFPNSIHYATLALEQSTDPFLSSLIYNQLGNSYKAMTQFDLAEENYRKSIELNPEYSAPHISLGLVRILSSRLKDAWQEYAWIIQDNASFPQFEQPVWNGETLKDKKVVYLAEQGLGDEILFANMFREFISLTGDCTIECDYRLIPLFERTFPEATFVKRQTPPSDELLDDAADFKAWGSNIASVFRSELAQFPAQPGYLMPSQERADYWKQQLENIDNNIKVGVCWRSMNRSTARNFTYSDITTDWGKILQTGGITFINLQYDRCEEELAAVEKEYGVKVHNLSLDLMNDQDELAALISSLDLVVSSHTAVASLAGAIGKETFVLTTPQNWSMLGTDHFPWYPNSKAIIKQPNESWESRLNDFSTEFGAWVDQRKQGH